MNKVSGKIKLLNRLISMGAAGALVASAGVYAADNTQGGLNQTDGTGGQVTTPGTSSNDRTGGEVGTTQQDGRMTTPQQDRDATDSDVVGTTGQQQDTSGLQDRNSPSAPGEERSAAGTTRDDPGLRDDQSVADTDEDEDDSGWFHPRARSTTATEEEDLIDDQDDPREDSIVDREERGIYDPDRDDDELVDTGDQRDRDSIN